MFYFKECVLTRVDFLIALLFTNDFSRITFLGVLVFCFVLIFHSELSDNDAMDQRIPRSSSTIKDCIRTMYSWALRCNISLRRVLTNLM